MTWLRDNNTVCGGKKMEKPIYIRLEYIDFEALVNGEPLTVEKQGKEIKIYLADIGFLTMKKLVNEAIERAIYNE